MTTPMSGWTPERRKRQATLIRGCNPWTRPPGPSPPEGKARTRMNAYTGGRWLMLRELARLVNAEVKASKNLIERWSM